MSTSTLTSKAMAHNEDPSESSDDFVMLDEPTNLAVRSKGKQPEETLSLECNAINANQSFLVSIHPPSKPRNDVSHVSCDIVLVIDVSGSMAELAPLPDVEDEEERESSGLTVLDLVRHACRTIISTLNENDRLSLITFSQDAKVVQSLTHMTPEAKAETMLKVEALVDEGATNLWAGIKAGLRQFESNPHIGNVQGVFVLTDGQPNYMCPQQGYVPKLKPILDSLKESDGSTPSIQTFGFGYSIRSDLMLSIAKVGNGNYAFIPEVGMIGTVFVHAVANLYATYAVNAVIELTIPRSAASDLYHTSGLPVERPSSDCLLIKLGNIQYGQSRDLVVFNRQARLSTPIHAKVTYNRQSTTLETNVTTTSLKGSPTLPRAVLDYHLLRNGFCEFFSSLYPVDATKDQHTTTAGADIKSLMPNYEALVCQIASISNHESDPNLSALLSDLVGPQLNPATPELGQVCQALQTEPQNKNGRIFKSFWSKWGRHYLSSQWCAHMRQTCNSFKDAGPLRYGVNSELFKRCRDELDAAFDALPAPTGTYRARTHFPGGRKSHGHGLPGMNHFSARSTPVSMSRYNRRDNVCFGGTCTVTLPNRKVIMVQDLTVGTSILNPLTNQARDVINIVKSTSSNIGQEICCVGETLWITPWHPIFDPSTQKWVFPHTVAKETRTLRPHEPVYSVQLAASDHPDDHVVEISDVACLTLGHGLVADDANDDVRAHPFFGDHARVRRCLEQLDTDDQGHRLSGGLLRDQATGLACGLAPASGLVERDSDEDTVGVVAPRL